jgi:hypothetical protein
MHDARPFLAMRGAERMADLVDRNLRESFPKLGCASPLPEPRHRNHCEPTRLLRLPEDEIEFRSVDVAVDDAEDPLGRGGVVRLQFLEQCATEILLPRFVVGGRRHRNRCSDRDFTPQRVREVRSQKQKRLSRNLSDRNNEELPRRRRWIERSEAGDQKERRNPQPRRSHASVDDAGNREVLLVATPHPPDEKRLRLSTPNYDASRNELTNCSNSAGAVL